MGNLLDLYAIDDLRFVTQKKTDIAIAPEKDILMAIAEFPSEKIFQPDVQEDTLEEEIPHEEPVSSFSTFTD